MPPSWCLRVCLPVAVHDRLLRGKANQSQLGRSLPSEVPATGGLRRWLEDAVRRNRLPGNNTFDDLLTSVPIGKTWLKVYAPKADRKRTSVAAGLVKRSLHFQGHLAFVVLEYRISEFSRLALDDVALLAHLQGQLSDGWGDGVSQFSFGPRVVQGRGDRFAPVPGSTTDYDEEKETDPDVMGRYSFNLTIVGASLA